MTIFDTKTREGDTLETAPTRHVEGGGARFAYRRLGASTGTPLNPLRHFSGNIDAWDPAVVSALAADRDVVAFDNAGVGRSTGTSPDNIAGMARDAVILFCAAFPASTMAPRIITGRASSETSGEHNVRSMLAKW